MKIGCVVLASGSAKRFGENKLLADFCGKPLIVHTLNKLRSMPFDRVVVVSVYPEIRKLCEELGFLSVMPNGDEQNDSILAGVGQMEEMDGCMFCVGDQPLCKKNSIENLIDAFYKNPTKIIRLYSGDIPGNPVIYPSDLFCELKTLPQGKSGKVIIKKYPERLFPVQAQNEYELLDVDTKHQLEEMEKLYNKTNS